MKNFNERIIKLRVEILKEISSIIGNRVIDVSGDCIYITDEEDNERNEIETVTKDFVIFYGSDVEMDLGDIGTDDLMSIYEAINTK